MKSLKRACSALTEMKHLRYSEEQVLTPRANRWARVTAFSRQFVFA